MKSLYTVSTSVRGTLVTVSAYLSVCLFTTLVAAALFDMFYMQQHELINLPIPPATPTHFVDTRQLDCMAQNIYYEAQGESAQGKAMVGMVVIERTRSPHFPQSICGVVFQANTDTAGNIIKYQCSFSWVCDGKDHDIDLHNPIDRREWMQSYAIAKLVIAGKNKTKIDMDGVTHYHANYVKPYWSKDRKDYKMVARVGDHLFYRWSKAMLPKLNVAMY